MTLSALITTLDAAAPILYAMSLIAALRAFVQSRPSPTLPALTALAGGCVVQTFSLTIKGIAAGQIPVMGMFGALSFIAWSLALCLIFLETHLRSSSISVFVLPFVILFAGLSLMLGDGPASGVVMNEMRGRGLLFGAHMASGLFSYSCFALTFAAGMMYLLLGRELHARHASFFFRSMPPLETIDKINTHAMGLGLIMITVAIVTGGVALATASEGLTWGDDAKIGAATLTLILYATNLYMAVHGNWRGRRAAIASVWIFTVVLVLFFGVNLLFSSLHGSL